MRRHEPTLRLLRRLRWTVRRPLATYLGGDERSLVRGAGVELAEMREYQPGDDVRLIDWNTSARGDRVYVREAFVERGLDVFFVVDVSGSVDWGTAACLKRDRALEAVGLVGDLLIHQGNRVGALFFANKPLDALPPTTGQNALLRLLDRVKHQPRQAPSGPTDLTAALERVGALARRRSLVIVVSDFLAADGWETPMKRLAVRHEVAAVRVVDPRDGEIPDVGVVTFEDPETGAQLVVDTGDAKLRERFREAALAKDTVLAATLRRSGVPLLRLSTDADVVPALVAFLREQRRPAAGRSSGPVA